MRVLLFLFLIMIVCYAIKINKRKRCHQRKKCAKKVVFTKPLKRLNFAVSYLGNYGPALTHPAPLGSAPLRKRVSQSEELARFAQTHTVVAQFKERMFSLQYFDPHYKLRYCQVQKNMSTMMTIMLCDLYSRRKRNNGTTDPLCYRNAGGVLKDSIVHTRKAVWKPLKPEQIKLWNKKITSFVIVRDPIERFVSAFGHLCRYENFCGVSGANVHTMAHAIFEFFQRGKALPGLDSEKISQLRVHFAPQNWYCHMADPLAKNNVKILRYSEDQNANIAMVDDLFKGAGINKETRELTLQRMRTEKTWHAGNSSNKNQWLNEVYSNSTTLEWILRTYYWDYVLLELPFPRTI